MSYIELLQDNPIMFFVVVILSLVITVLVYSAFPVIFAKTRKSPITKKKYKRLCYGINIIGMVFFYAFNGVVSGGPYLLWTWVFARYGIKALDSKSLLIDVQDSTKETLTAPPQIRFCRKCGAHLDDGIRFCPQCGTEIKTEE